MNMFSNEIIAMRRCRSFLWQLPGQDSRAPTDDLRTCMTVSSQEYACVHDKIHDANKLFFEAAAGQSDR